MPRGARADTRADTRANADADSDSNADSNSDSYSQVGAPTDKEQCKKGGWRTFNAPRTFKNQGDCIQFVNTGK